MSDSNVMNSHERINTNNCFFNYKYEYKYVTTYDFDEIIFPRKFQLVNELTEQNCRNYTPKNINYNIFDYADNLFKKYLWAPSCLEFENLVFLQANDLNLVEFISNILNYENGYKMDLVMNNNKMKITYKLDTVTYVVKLQKQIKFATCMKEYLNLSPSLNSIWQSVFGSLMNMRNGKSIFSTDHTEGINQHYTDISKSNLNECFKISINDGFCSHFRENADLFFNNQTYSIKHFIVDIEYLLFLTRYQY